MTWQAKRLAALGWLALACNSNKPPTQAAATGVGGSNLQQAHSAEPSAGTSDSRPPPAKPRVAADCDSGVIGQPGTKNANLCAIDEVEQDGHNLCWAANVQMLTAFVSNDAGVEQCKQAQYQFRDRNLPDCCSSHPVPGPCDNPGIPDFEHFGYSVEQTGRWLSWDDVVAELNQRPFSVTEQYDNGGAHMIVIRGTAIVDDYQLVVSFDPLNGYHTWRVYEYYRKGPDFTPGPVYYGVAKEADPGAPAAGGPAPPPSSSATPVSVAASAQPEPVGAHPLLSRDETRAEGEKLIKTLANEQPRLFGFSSQQEANDAKIEIRNDETIERWGSQSSRLTTTYLAIYVNDSERGQFAMVGKRTFHPYLFETNLRKDEIANAKALLAHLHQTFVRVVYVPEWGGYLLRTQAGTFLPTRAFPGLNPLHGPLVTEADIKHALELGRPRPMIEPHTPVLHH